MKRTLNTLYIWFSDDMITGSKFWIRLRYHTCPTSSLSISSRGSEIDWKRTRVGTIRSFHLWTYNILPLIPTDPPPTVGHFYHRNRPNLYLLAQHAIDLWTSIDLVNMCRGMHEPNGMPKLRREATRSGGKVKLQMNHLFVCTPEKLQINIGNTSMV